MFTLKTASLLLVVAGLAHAEVHSLTLQQALEIAARQNPEVALARLDAQRAEQGVKIAADPFRPKVYAGGGLPTLTVIRTVSKGMRRACCKSGPIWRSTTGLSVIKSRRHGKWRAARNAAQAKADDVAYQAADLFLSASRRALETKPYQDRFRACRR